MQDRTRRGGRRLGQALVAVLAMLLVVAPIKTEAGTTSYSLSGLVTTSSGDPVAGATIELKSPSDATISTSTAADGTYSFSDVALPSGESQYVNVRAVPPDESPLLPAGWRTSGAPPARWDEDFGDAIEVDAGIDVSDIDITLLAAGQISGVVRDTDANPVPDTEVQLLQYDSLTGIEATSGPDGSYTIDRVQPGPFEVIGFPPEGSPWVFDFSDPVVVDEGAEVTVDVTLPVGAAVSGTVLDAGGLPVEGVRVHVEILDSSNPTEETALTGADGSYRVQGLDTRHWPAGADGQLAVVWFEPPAASMLARQFHPFLDTPSSGITFLNLALGTEVADIDAELKTKGSLSGTVTGADGEPAAGVQVTFTSPHPYLSPELWTAPPPTQTDASGHWDVGPLDGGPWQIRYDPPPGSPDAEAWHGGYHAIQEGPGGDAVRVTSVSGTVVEEQLPLGGAIRGRVIGPHGSTPAVTITADAGTGWTGSCLCGYHVDNETGATDAHGDYSVVGLMVFGAYMIGFSPESGSGLVGQYFDGISAACVAEQWATDCGARNTLVNLGEVTAGIDARLEPECAAAPFPDVALTNPHCNEITDAAATGALLGYPDGTFQPNRQLTRLGAVVALWRLAGSPTGHATGPSTFTDITATQPYRNAIEWAADEGITTGYPDGTFRPSAIVTRQAAVTYLWRMAGKPNEGTASGFHDIASNHPFAKAITWASNHLITRGYPDGTFRSLDPTNRASYAALLYWAPALD